ncbi:hypothetical protein SS1G_09804 [Sclerotinia sclerotiorum 1980 UF-70]|uniref:BTB domain-containing protein n=2 Tax=Sclerotinia sclerotiorum (strain ATCC 18683 / 1980 / Ss-1) TaxID=665079 RepID=A7EWU5_SCLS1|nr:hypothetical protein SS1G_09804 [Sclerotinia sclerotiorum 1980 UF-70]APA05386.1 hypothetical protein sscle_01g001560 [Sclerotinia sclerotiorum 1980 UF-70]EDN93937.1 hypothetical protein SS1G_09804 [Sclerotinia sclerotiorum 1980 UF-70]
MTNTFQPRFLRALFPQQFPEGQKSSSSHQAHHRNKRVKYIHEPSSVQEDIFEEYDAVDTVDTIDQGGEDDENQLRLEHKSCAKAMIRRKMAERVTIDPDGDLLLILNERRKCSKRKIEALAVVPIDDSGIGMERGTDGEVAEVLETVEEDSYNADVEKEKEKKPMELKEIHMLVSSKHMVLVSPVFKAMLQWSNFKDGYAMKAHGKVEVPLPDDDPEAMRILVDIVHCHHKDVPRKVKLGLLTHLAILVDKYRLHEAVQIYSDMWISHAKKRFPSSMAEDGTEVCLQWLCISWVFEKSRDFTAMTRIFQQESTQSLSEMISDSAWDIPVPTTVIDNIEQDRIRALDEAISALRDTIETYQTSTLVCRGRPTHLPIDQIPQHNKQCDAMVLGMLIKEAIYHNLYPLPEAPYTGHSFISIYDSYQNFDIKNGCEVVLLCNSHPDKEVKESKHVFGDVLMDLLMPIEESLGGLELNGFKVSLGLV